MTVSDYSVNQLRELAKKAVELKLRVLRSPDESRNVLRQRSLVIFDWKIVTFQQFPPKY